MPRMVISPVLLSATLFTSGVHVDGLLRIPFQPETLSYKSSTISLVNESLRDPDISLNDETMLAVLILMYTEVCFNPCGFEARPH